ncbi:MAG: hypothetical protein DYG93_08205 [Leptolyngbya sp. PLA2]|nr:hypothetical protein [Leptolyngbya sp.]MCE7971631.1 hypothetical protein [Leptolyngbya sp. PL-A2]MCQ3940049.1 hypothetical protein [cyanobacterium CYA1]MCZ7633658.1 DUF3137 domain-containing protein [Phycisphaerales bacterium]MDL1903209.1 hypothetical protein [Synechococcales cyanobacterium CNB]GIK17906.1 MAG: hypothetical protein BroJett004_00700 [Planctomycetota bacterium]
MTIAAIQFPEAVFAVLGVLVLIAIVWAVHFASVRRREALAALADRLGLRFDARRDRRHDDEYSHFEVFRQGHSRAAYNTISGTITLVGRECRIKTGDFTYTVNHGKSSTAFNLSYLILHLPFEAAPDLLIRREGVFDKLAGAFGFPDINFESSEFSRRFHVRCRDRKFAYDVVTPRMMEFLLATDPGVIDIERARLCMTDGTRRWTPEEFESRIRWVGDFLARWPEHVTAALEAGSR